MSNEAQIDPNKSVNMTNANQEENKEGNTTRYQEKNENKTRNDETQSNRMRESRYSKNNNKSQIKTTKLPIFKHRHHTGQNEKE